MSEWNELAHFLYGRGFWYADPLGEIRSLTDDQLYWTPSPKSLPIIWHVGHIAHRERVHVGVFLQGKEEHEVIPPEFEVFGPDWASVDDIREAVGSTADALRWVRDVREESHRFIETLGAEDFHRKEAVSDLKLTVAHWLFITTAHTAIHIGRIQLLRALIEDKKERAC